jgi:hypothetical protein
MPVRAGAGPVDEIHGANVRVFLSTCAAPGLAQRVQGVEQVVCGLHWWRQNHVAISQDVLPPPQVTLPRPLCAAFQETHLK